MSKVPQDWQDSSKTDDADAPQGLLWDKDTQILHTQPGREVKRFSFDKKDFTVIYILTSYRFIKGY